MIDKFIKYINDIGFDSPKNMTDSTAHSSYGFYWIIISNNTYYSLYRLGMVQFTANIHDLKPLQNIFKKELRSIKLKKLLK